MKNIKLGVICKNVELWSVKMDIKQLKNLAASCSVLYVEDEAELAVQVIEFLKKIFARVEYAPNGAQGLEKYKDGVYDLVITDILMPQLNGIEMCKQIRQLNDSQDIIVVSAHKDIHDIVNVINLGVDGYLLKPASHENIIRELGRVLKKIVAAKENVRYQKELQHMVDEKTAELVELNSSLKKRVEEELQKLIEKDKILIHQSRLAIMGEVISMIAHQWRQPLSALALNIQTVGLDYMADNINKEVMESFVDESMETIKKMSKTIDGFRSFFRPDGKQELFCVNDSISEALNIMNAMLTEEGVKVELSATENYYVTNYRSEFEQVMLILLTNAMDAIIENKTVDPKISIQVIDRRNEHVGISIIDNGGGIPYDIIDKVFDPYFSTKSKNGAGLGLYMSKEIIERQMGGKIDAFDIGGGVEFRIQI